jgi:hypothetical protein
LAAGEKNSDQIQNGQDGRMAANIHNVEPYSDLSSSLYPSKEPLSVICCQPNMLQSKSRGVTGPKLILSKPDSMGGFSGLAGGVRSRVAQSEVRDEPKPNSRNGEHAGEDGQERRVERDRVVRRPLPEGGEMGLLILAAFGCGIGCLIVWGAAKWRDRLHGNRNRQRDT